MSDKQRNLFKKGLLDKKSLEELDRELSEELIKEKVDCQERIHGKLLSIELIKNGMEPIV